MKGRNIHGNRFYEQIWYYVDAMNASINRLEHNQGDILAKQACINELKIIACELDKIAENINFVDFV